MSKKTNLVSIDLFAGCGGLSLGLENAGFNPIFVNELNSDALQTYLINRDEQFPLLRKKYWVQDIKEIIKNEHWFDDFSSGIKTDYKRNFLSDSVDIVVGGPPCQGFSGLGIRRSYSVDKHQLPSNHLYQDMAFFIHRIRPKAFVFENVEGLLSAKWTKEGIKGEIFNDVLETFRHIPEYQVKYKLVHAKDYGVPQNRPRILIVGFRTDIFSTSNNSNDAVECGFLPEPTESAPNLIDVLDDLIDENFIYGGATNTYLKNYRTDFQKMLRTRPDGSLMKQGELLTDQEYSKHSEKVVAKFKAMIENNGVIPKEYQTKKFAQRLLPKIWGPKGASITATSLPDDFVHFSQARTPTVREWARIQTFPDWYNFAGKRTTGGIRRAGNPRENIFDREVPKYTQIGNAVPVKLGEAVGKHIANILLKKIS
jgi:DNA (cytosine-5)-methyltransferase 1